MECGVSHSEHGRDVGQTHPRAVNFEYLLRARARLLGRANARHGNGGGHASDGDAHRVHARRGPTVRRHVPLLPRAQLRRHRDDLHQHAELCRPGLFLPHALRRDDGAVALLVSKKLLPLLHVRRVRSLSRTGLRPILQAGAGRAPVPTKPLGPHHGRVHTLRTEARRPRHALHARRLPARPRARLGHDRLAALPARRRTRQPLRPRPARTLPRRLLPGGTGRGRAGDRRPPGFHRRGLRRHLRRARRFRQERRSD